MKTCAIIANGYYHGESMVDQINSLSKELEKLEVLVDKIYTDSILCFISGTNMFSSLTGYDFIVFLDKDPYISHMLEAAGFSLVNSAKAIELCDDKMKTYIHLVKHGINVPNTISSPLNYAGVDDGLSIEIANLLEYPVVIKEVYGSMGRGVHLAKNSEELINIRKQFKKIPHLYQKFVGIAGRDIRVIVIGGKAVGAMERINDKDFRSNIELGGVGVNFTLTDDIIKISEEAAKALELDYCGVDILRSNGKNYVAEVNSNAFFKGFTKATGINVAKLYAEYLYQKFYS